MDIDGEILVVAPCYVLEKPEEVEEPTSGSHGPSPTPDIGVGRPDLHIGVPRPDLHIGVPRPSASPLPSFLCTSTV